jgi:transposase
MKSPDSKTLLIRLGLLSLAEALNSVSEACRTAGISRSLYYKLKAAYERAGVEGLKPVPRRAPKMPNAFSAEVVEHVMEKTKKFPSYSYNRIADLLRKEGLKISGSGVRKVWRRCGLNRAVDRYRWLAREAKEGRAELSPKVRKILEKDFKEELCRD